MAGAAAAAHLAGARLGRAAGARGQPGYHSTGRSAALFTETYGNRDDPHPDNGEPRLLSRPRGRVRRASDPDPARRDALRPRRSRRRALKGAWAEMSPLDPTIRWLGGGAARDLVPVLRPERVDGAILEPDAMDIDVHALHQGYLRLLRRARRAHRDRCRGGGAGAARRRVGGGDPGGELRGAGRGQRGGGLGGCGGRAGRAAAGGPDAEAADGADRRGARRSSTRAGWPMVIDAEETVYFKPDAGKLVGLAGRRDAGRPRHPARGDRCRGRGRPADAGDDDHGRAGRAANGRGCAALSPTTRRSSGSTSLADGFFWLAGQGGYGIMTARGHGPDRRRADRRREATGRDRGGEPGPGRFR